MPISDLPTVAASLRALGVSYGLQGLDHDTLEILRVEAGLPVFGIDFDSRTIPQELDRNAATLSFTKGCYLGQETVARLDAMGHVNKIFRGVACPMPADAPAPSPGTSILWNDAEVGTITSLVYSPGHQKYLGLAMVRTRAAEPGTTVQIARADASPIEGVICELPFDRQ